MVERHSIIFLQAITRGLRPMFGRVIFTCDEGFKSIYRVLGPLTKKPTLGVQHEVEAGYLFKEHASISAWFFNFPSCCEVTKPLSRIKTITRMRRIYKRRLVIPGFIISGYFYIKWIFLVQGDVCGDLALIPTLPLSLNSSDLTITNVS